VYVSVHNVRPTRKTFYITVVAFLILSFGLIFGPEGTDDGRLVGYWSVFCTLLYVGLGYLIIFRPQTRDLIFGFSRCPHCDHLSWSIKDKLKITNNPLTNLGVCSICNRHGKISFFYTLPMFVVIFSWLFFLVFTGSISAAFLSFIVVCILWLLYFARYVPISR
jgi:hypothetical protein